VARQQLRFGEQLRHYREAAGFSQEGLAERAGLSANAISALERGERKRPHPDTLRRLAEALGLDEEARSNLVAALRPREEALPGPAPVIGSPVTSMDDVPDPMTPLIGREREVAVVEHLLLHADGRLLTLIGPGGVGKTRLAVHLVRIVSDHFPDGVAWVDLAPLTDATLVLPTIARAVGVEDAPGADAGKGLRSHLRDRRMLLALDNFEHVLDGAMEMAALLHTCPGLVMLVTSRAPLNIRGEQEYLVPPLELPLAGRTQSVSELVTIPSVQLFTWHVQRRDPSYELSQEHAPAVAEICRRLDGVPLALELAAARVRLLGTSELLTRLNRALPVLTGGLRDLPERQRTLEGAIRWSYNLLTPPEQDLFCHLAVFAGGWTLEAAEVVGTPDAGQVEEVFDRLGSLVEQSLVTVTHAEHGPRYRFLEPVRHFALERLAERGQTEETRGRHARFYVALAERAAQEIEGQSNQVAWLDRLDREHDNLRAVLTWCEHAPDEAETGLRLASALWRFWEVRGHTIEGIRWLTGALRRSEEVSFALRAKALSATGNLARDRADYDLATTCHEQSLAIRRDLGDTLGIARSLNNLGVIARDRGDAGQTIRLCQESLTLFRSVGDQHGAAIALISLAMGADQQGDHQQARSHYEESLALFRASGDIWHVAWVLAYLAHLMVDKGDFTAVRCFAGESLGLHRAAGDAWGVAMALGALGKAACAVNDLGTAAIQFEEGLRLLAEAGVERAIPEHLENLAGVALAGGQPGRAARLGGAAEALRERAGVTRAASKGLADPTGLRAGPHADEWAAGRMLNREQVIAEAAALLKASGRQIP
jgi:predicted ATPase/transcriptional regulator with XRE-family HTH domain